MNTSLTAYTHLESLLLFQSLHAYGVDPQVFSRISELLKAHPSITADKRFQSGRLSPDALRNFYLLILKEEVRNERDQADGEVTNGDVKGSRKRKAPSPSLPTVQESLQHQHLIPKLVNKLYAHYRAAITEQIRQDEDRYERLQRELQGIERGEWDNQIKERANGKSASRSPSLPKKSPLLPQQPSPAQPNANAQAPDANRANGPGAPFHPNLAPAPPQNGQAAKPGPSPSPRKKQPSADKKGKQSTPQLPGSSQPPQTPRSGQPSTNAPHVPSTTNQPPHLQSHPSTPGPQSVSTPGSQHVPFQGFPQHLQSGHASGPQFQQPIQPYMANGVPQLAPSPGPHQPQHSPTHQRFAGPPQPNSQSPSVQTQHPRGGYVPIAGQPPYLPQHPQPGQPPPQGGFMLPPFQVAPQDPSRSQQQAQHQVSTPVSGRQSSTKVTPYSGRPAAPSMQAMHGQPSNFGTPVSIRDIVSALSSPRRTPQTTAKTAWKPRASLGTPGSHPEPEPIDDFEPDVGQQQSSPKPRTTRKSRAKSKAKQKEQEPEPESHVDSDQQTEETVPEMETRQGRPRRKAPIKKGRPGSIASSQAGTSVRGRSRSHSILSHTETIAADTESQTGSRIKSEDVVDDELAATPSHMSTRGRGAAKPNKRKRNLREVSPDDSEDQSGTPGLPRTAVATRHFSRMCAPLMNDIGSHKHASTFTTAVKAKDAEGYYDIIKRPTDIKTIQKAIAAGAKQVAAAASGDTPSGSPGGAGGIVELPLTTDNMPPKAIVNSAQLEKELMRMFVNAVMFNPGEEGVVEDAREMFESVQRSVSSWRSVEPSNGRMEVEETPPVGEEDVPVAAKRRKL